MNMISTSDNSNTNRNLPSINLFASWIDRFSEESGSFLDFTRSYNHFGLNINADGDLEYREWAPAAQEVSLVLSFPTHSYSSETSTDGTGNRTSALRTISVFGPWFYPRTKTAPSLSLTSLGSSAASPSKTGRR